MTACAELAAVRDSIKKLKSIEETLLAQAVEELSAKATGKTVLEDGRVVKLAPGRRTWKAERVAEHYPQLYEMARKPAIDAQKLKSAAVMFDVDIETVAEACTTVGKPFVTVGAAK